MPAFLEALQAQGWIRRGEAPANSRWWRLVEGPSAPMYGVFTAYEKQLWHDWIAAGWQAPGSRVMPGSWEEPLQLDTPLQRTAQETDIETLIDSMAGNRHATPEGLLATQGYLRATGLAQEEPR